MTPKTAGISLLTQVRRRDVDELTEMLKILVQVASLLLRLYVPLVAYKDLLRRQYVTSLNLGASQDLAPLWNRNLPAGQIYPTSHIAPSWRELRVSTNVQEGADLAYSKVSAYGECVASSRGV